MTLTSAAFLAMFLISLGIYYIVPNKIKWLVLLAFSIIFFCQASGWKMLVWLCYGILVTYVGTLAIERAGTVAKRRCSLVIVFMLLVGELFALKYAFNVGNVVKRILSWNIDLSSWDMLAPIGISYYTLSILGYTLDVYYGTSKAEKNLLKHSLFTCYFPQMISGPIVKYAEMKEQLFGEKHFDFDHIARGLQRMALGYFKKCVVADRLGVFVQAVYGSDASVTGGGYILAATIAYAFQLYTDFSGCMDIVLGVSQCYEVQLPENFRSPFYSESLAEFWRRWHITLGVWFKEYVFYPLLKSSLFQKIGKFSKKKLGKKKGKQVPTYLGLMVIWFLIGLWHGGTIMYFVASGAIPGIYLIGSEVLQPFFRWLVKMGKINTACGSYRLFRRVRTVLLMCVCWIFVCAGSTMGGIMAFKNMVSIFNPWIWIDGSLLNMGWEPMDFVIACLGILFVLYWDFLDNKGVDVYEKISRQNLLFRWAVWWILLLSILLFGMFGQSSFIYFQF